MPLSHSGGAGFDSLVRYKRAEIAQTEGGTGLRNQEVRVRIPLSVQRPLAAETCSPVARPSSNEIWKVNWTWVQAPLETDAAGEPAGDQDLRLPLLDE